MGLNNDKLSLVYGFNIEEIVKISELTIVNNLPSFKVIEKHLLKEKVKNIIEGINLPTVPSKLINEKVVLFNNLDDNELEKNIKAYRECFKDEIIFAVVTPVSIDWTFEELLSHLVKEKEWANKLKKR